MQLICQLITAINILQVLEYHNLQWRGSDFAGIRLWFKIDPVHLYNDTDDMEEPGVPGDEQQPSTPSGAAPSADATLTPLKKPASKLAKGKAKASPKVPPTPMKAKAKAKASPKVPPTPMMVKKAPKAKPTVKAAAKVKSSTKKGLKRPAAMVVPGGSKQASMKKPASSRAVGSSKPQGGAPSWSLGLEDEVAASLDHEGGEEETLEFDEEESVDKFEVVSEHRDRVKGNKFKQLLAQGSLPDWCKKAWQATLTMKVGKVAAQTKLINNVLSRDEKGSIKLQLDAPALTELKAWFVPSVSVT